MGTLRTGKIASLWLQCSQPSPHVTETSSQPATCCARRTRSFERAIDCRPQLPCFEWFLKKRNGSEIHRYGEKVRIGLSPCHQHHREARLPLMHSLSEGKT